MKLEGFTYSLAVLVYLSINSKQKHSNELLSAESTACHK